MGSSVKTAVRVIAAFGLLLVVLLAVVGIQYGTSITSAWLHSQFLLISGAYAITDLILIEFFHVEKGKALFLPRSLKWEVGFSGGPFIFFLLIVISAFVVDGLVKVVSWLNFPTSGWWGFFASCIVLTVVVADFEVYYEGEDKISDTREERTEHDVAGGVGTESKHFTTEDEYDYYGE
jgi:hypothetical protein